MRLNSQKLIVFINFIFFFSLFNGNYLAQTEKKSIIKLFCLSNFKEEMLKANLRYNEVIADETCECYLDNFLQTSSHQKAITKCKLEAQEKFKLKPKNEKLSL